MITTAGAKVLPFIKIWGILPMVLLLTYVLYRLNNRMNLEKVFYTMTSGFLLFFLVFAFYIYPNRELLQPNHSADFLQRVLPAGFDGFVSLYRHWTLTLFYALAELWSSFVLSSLFWGFANAVIPVGEAKRHYGVLMIGSNLAALVSGQAANYLATFYPESWESTVKLLLGVVAISGIITMFLFRWLNQNVFTKESYPKLHASLGVKKKKKRPSIRESFQFLSQSKYLIFLATLVVSYFLAINLFEIIWKDYLHKLIADPHLFNHYMNNITSMVGLISLGLTLFIPHMMERLGWTRVALITPLIVAITGAGFFIFLFLNRTFPTEIVTLFKISPLAIAVFFGATQCCLSKAAKYSVFDTTKEMAFIPLEHEVRLKSKAPIDAVGARFGKFGGSFVYQILLLGTGSLTACIPFISFLLIGVIAFWIVSTRNLGKLFDAKVKEQSEAPETLEGALSS